MTVQTTKSTARLIEIFSAIQGEGLNVGTRQIFIRFALCDLRCHFCDSAHTWDIPTNCRIEKLPGSREFEIHPNPVTLPILIEWVKRQNIPRLHDSISLTGGEPLLHSNFLRDFLPKVRFATGLPIYLETGGHRPEQLTNIVPYIDSVGMDLKLPSTSGESHWESHSQFLQICNSANLEVFVKIVISQETSLSDLEQAALLIKAVSPKIPVFLQPATPLDLEKAFADKQIFAPSPKQVLNWQALLKQSLDRVRVIPQTHKVIDQL